MEGIAYANLNLFDLAIEPLTQAYDFTKLNKVPFYIHERAKCYLMENLF